MSYFDNLRALIPASEIAEKAGLSYLSAAIAVSRAGRPTFSFVEFRGADGQTSPYLPLFDGAVVAVELMVGDVPQIMYLPVMDADNQAKSLKDITLTDINNSRQRCLVKAIAAVTGVGMSVFLGKNGDGEKAASMLGVEPTTDLATVSAVFNSLKEGKGAPYIEWNVGLAAARIVDESFTWRVDLSNGLPYREVLGCAQVDVTSVFKGKPLTLGLPIMDAAFNPIPVDKVSVFDWNKTVMRALTKGIAFNSGYGLAVYADETGIKTEAVSKGAKSLRGGKKDAAKVDQAPVEASTTVDPSAGASANAAATEVPPAAQAEQAPVQTVTTVTEPALEQPQAPAEAEAPAQVAEQPKAAPESEAEPTTASKTAANGVNRQRAEAIEKFKGVMKNRRDKDGVQGLLTLFKALSESVVFKEEDKPDCFVTLVAGIAPIVTPKEVLTLLEEMAKHNVAALLPADTLPLVTSRLVDVALQGAVDATKGDSTEDVEMAAKALISAGLAGDAVDVFELSQQGTLSAEVKAFLAGALDGCLIP